MEAFLHSNLRIIEPNTILLFDPQKGSSSKFRELNGDYAK